MSFLSTKTGYMSRMGSWFVPLMIIAAGTYLRLKGLGAKSFWMDEAVSWIYSTLDWVTFWRGMWQFEGNMVLYSLILRLWVYLGDSAWIIRSLSVIFGVMTIPALYALGARHFNRTVGIISAVLLAVNGFHIDWSQVARSYSLVVLLLVLSTYFYYCALDTPLRNKYWIAYVITSVFAVYAHIFAILVIIAQWLSLNLAQFRRIRPLTLFIVGGTLLTFITPMIVFILFGGKGQLDWIQRPTIWNILYTATIFVGDRGYRLLFAYALICFVPWPFVLRSKIERSLPPFEWWKIRSVFWWLFFPVFIMLTSSFTIKPVLESRYLIISTPSLMLFTGISLSICTVVFPRYKMVAVAGCLFLIVLSTMGFNDFFKRISNEDARRSVAQYVLSSQQPGDAAMFYIAPEYLSFLYYAHQEAEVHGYISSPDVVFPPFDIPRNVILVPDREQLMKALEKRNRVWLVTNMEWWVVENTENLKIISMMRTVLQEENFQLEEERQFSQDGTPAKLVELYIKGR